GLKIEGQANVQLGFSTRLQFGISTSNGVFLGRSFIDDLSIQLDASLPTSADPAGLKAWMGTLPYRGIDRGTGLHGVYHFTLNGSSDLLTYANLIGGVGGGGSPTQLRTTAQGIILGGFSSTGTDYITAHDVDIHLTLQTDLPTGTALPTYKTDLDITGWRFT